MRGDFHFSISPCEGGLRGDFSENRVLVIPAQAGEVPLGESGWKYLPWMKILN